MKLLTAKRVKSSWQLWDEHKNLVGERVFVSFLWSHKQLKIKGENYNIKNVGVFAGEIHYYNENERLMIKIDHVHERLFYYGQTVTEIYCLKSKTWSKNTMLCKLENDEVVMKFNYRWSFFKQTYEIEIENDCNDNLLILAFMDYNVRNFEE
ncbi:hypothetical protein [Chryseobacterium sp. Hurlbut01]|jgi:hypothetical protein|uniref:hypothetical protein n=1 Tax=Chryseobacterium sp. Hurlbut01 TaxID=1681828 RepID=UPI00067BA010|nr:hypothetical protein [Chryseobacterium sp. Hurlbut01]KNB60715.1 hypothetical protein AC804_16245 [Chryseobacterium sp. Hurlbut01]